MVKTDLGCSLFQLTGFVAFAISELLSYGMALVASCQTVPDPGECLTADTWCVSADMVKNPFQWVQSVPCLEIPAFWGCSSLRCTEQVEAVQWVLPQHCTQVLFTFVHIPCAFNTAVVCFYLFCFWHWSWYFTLAQSFPICKFHITSCFVPVSMGCTKADLNREHFQWWLFNLTCMQDCLQM